MQKTGRIATRLELGLDVLYQAPVIEPFLFYAVQVFMVNVVVRPAGEEL